MLAEGSGLLLSEAVVCLVLCLVKSRREEVYSESLMKRSVIETIGNICQYLKLASSRKICMKMLESLCVVSSGPTRQILQAQPQVLASEDESKSQFKIQELKFEIRIALIIFLMNCELEIDKWSVIVRMSSKKMKELVASSLADVCSEHKISPKVDLSKVLLPLEMNGIDARLTTTPLEDAIKYSKDFVSSFETNADKRSTNQMAPFVASILTSLRVCAKDDSVYERLIASLANRCMKMVEQSAIIQTSPFIKDKASLEEKINQMIKNKMSLKTVIEFTAKNYPQSAASSLSSLKTQLLADSIYQLATLDSTCIFKAWPSVDASSLCKIAIRRKLAQ